MPPRFAASSMARSSSGYGRSAVGFVACDMSSGPPETPIMLVVAGQHQVRLHEQVGQPAQLVERGSALAVRIGLGGAGALLIGPLRLPPLDLGGFGFGL